MAVTLGRISLNGLKNGLDNLFTKIVNGAFSLASKRVRINLIVHKTIITAKLILINNIKFSSIDSR